MSTLQRTRKAPFTRMAAHPDHHHHHHHHQEEKEEKKEKQDHDTSTNTTKTIESQWNITGLQQEVARQVYKSQKKIGKITSSRRFITTKEVEEEEEEKRILLRQEEDRDFDYDQEYQELQDKLKKFILLHEQLQELVQNSNKKKIKNSCIVLPESIATLAVELQCNDTPPIKPPRGLKKEKGLRPSEVERRKPYKRYYTCNKTEIRVGKQAQDNDELSCNPIHRDGADWWMHASGCAGSHVVIKCQDQKLDEEVMMDAAALAARQSKCTGNIVQVSLTRCRDVKKPYGAKPGLVQLSGFVQTIKVDMNKAQARFVRLDQTCLVN